MSTTTIAAIATAHGVGSIAIIRLSGPRALSIAKKLSKRDAFTPRHATLTPLYSSNHALLDEAIVLFFKAPYSFTAEDVVEFQCHGGVIVAQQILQATLDAGAELAMPGEFSKRAFYNGRIDLSEAEAIAQLIEAKSEDAAAILAKQMKGSLREYIENVRDELLHILAYSEVSIDYAEEDLPQDLIDQIMAKLNDLHVNLTRTLEASQSRAGLMQGFKVSIIGKPNVGKSSLLNALLNYSRAIVSDIAGTTRDTIEEQVKIGSHLIKIVDTAGIREAGDEIERIGIERSIDAIKESDIVIAVFDGSRKEDAEDEAIVELVRAYGTEKEIIVAINKSDLSRQFDASVLQEYRPLLLSCKSDTSDLIAQLKEIMDSKNSSDEIMLISARQVQAVRKTLQAIEDAYVPLEDQELEIFSFHLNVALHEIASITRPFENDEMLDKMFGSFCLGK
jgi:tRNA modification GTPase